jgi:hypothetical protein
MVVVMSVSCGLVILAEAKSPVGLLEDLDFGHVEVTIRSGGRLCVPRTPSVLI